MSTTRRPFYSAFWNFPGCLPEGDAPPPVFSDYRCAADYLAEALQSAADCYDDEDDPDGEAFLRAAADCALSTPEEGFAFHGADGLNYYTEEVDPLGYWRVSSVDDSDGEPAALIVYDENENRDGPSAREAADAVSSLCGSSVEAPSDMTAAYVSVESFRLAEAAAELREEGYVLLDEEGEEIDPESSPFSDVRDGAGRPLEIGDAVRYVPEEGQTGRGIVRGFARDPDRGEVVVDVDDAAGGDTTYRTPPEVERVDPVSEEAERDLPRVLAEAVRLLRRLPHRPTPSGEIPLDDAARGFCRDLLREVEIYDAGGCPLCLS